MKKLKLSFIKDVSYWNTNEGAGVKVDGTRDDKRWGVGVEHMNGYLNIEGVEDVQGAIVEYINKELYLESPLESSWLTVMDDGRITFCIVEDGEGRNIADEDNFKGQLYICDYDVMIELHEVSTPKADYLAHLLPKAERGF